jgi:ABC-type branched-subunit amino acid transport system ATPase component
MVYSDRRAPLHPMRDAGTSSEEVPSESREALLRVDSLSRTFGGLRALDDVSMEVRAGEIVGIIGPNGAGKTTLVNLITGFLVVETGSVTFRDRDIGAVPPHVISRLGIARTFQQIRLFKNMTVLENVLAGMLARTRSHVGHVLSRSKSFRRETADLMASGRALLQDVNLGGTEATVAGTLSYGQQRRLEIARALASEPRLLCLDEPAAGMNELESQELIGIVRGLPRRGTSILLIEHDMAVVRGVSDHVIALDHGAVIATGTVEGVLANPLVVEAYLGTPDA